MSTSVKTKKASGQTNHEPTIKRIDSAVKADPPTRIPFPYDLSAFQMIQVDGLTLDPDVQKYRHIDRRTAADKHVKTMVEKSNPDSVMCLGVVPIPDDMDRSRLDNPDATHGTVIGGHRLEYVRIKGYISVPCLVRDFSDEPHPLLAKIRWADAESDNMAQSDWDKFGRRHLVGYATEVEIEKTLNRFGLSAFGTDGWKQGVRLFYFAHSVGALGTVLTVACAPDLESKRSSLIGAWDMRDAVNRRVSVFYALTGLITNYQNDVRFKRDRLIASLRVTRPQLLWSLSGQAKTRKSLGNDRTQTLVNIMVHNYNQGLDRAARLRPYSGPQLLGKDKR
jgi:hypothetical protein